MFHGRVGRVASTKVQTNVRRMAITVMIAVFSNRSAALAQSSGNIAAAELSTVCEIATPPFSGSYTCVNPANGQNVPCPTFGSSTPLLETMIQTPSGNGTGLVITPSLDVGLFTDTVVSGAGTLTGSDSQETGVMVSVTVDGQPAQPEVQAGSPPGTTGVVYEQRFQQLSVNNLQCGGGGMCNIDFVLSSMSAHSFSFVFPNVKQGTHAINIYVTLTNPPNTTRAAACVGPGTLTVVQVKAFTQN